VRQTPWLSDDNQGLVKLLLSSHRRAFGEPLLASERSRHSSRLICQELFACGFPVLAHGAGDDPALTYANAAALQLWERPWAEMVGMPSRLTAPEDQQSARQRALGDASQVEAISNYRGIRINSQGRRFRIENARIWTLWDAEEQVCGQAASFSDWWWLSTG
jgi:hypothetical protein